MDEIRHFSGCEDLNDEQAMVLADFLAMYAQIVYNNNKKKIYA